MSHSDRHRANVNINFYYVGLKVYCCIHILEVAGLYQILTGLWPNDVQQGTGFTGHLFLLNPKRTCVINCVLNITAERNIIRHVNPWPTSSCDNVVD